jgi:hypothetical protein
MQTVYAQQPIVCNSIPTLDLYINDSFFSRGSVPSTSQTTLEWQQMVPYETKVEVLSHHVQK